ncbi:MAG: type II secretion system F family protein [Candidatus ainarchaeum sp.]|nr:type II secretion system F family protein [Candidatus ainarchaeum sp.]MDD5096800.1 type II secretion system F family protein [Candidatus ainarchaeum sp.]
MEKTKVTPVALPVRERGRGTRPFRVLSEWLMPYYPNMRKKLTMAGIEKNPEEFLDGVVVSALLGAATLSILSFLFLSSIDMDVVWLVPLSLLYLFMCYQYFMLYPDVKITKRKRDIDYELVFAGRHLLIALKSGMPLFDSLVGVSRGYGAVSEEFNRIVEKVTLGMSMTQAIREVIQNCPSNDYNRIMLQIANAINSGSDVADSLEVVLNQVFREQVIALKAYGQKLNPLVMFYMIFGIIFPSLGLAFAVILLSLIGSTRFGIDASILLLVFVMIAIIQFLFLAMVESSRPKYVI